MFNDSGAVERVRRGATHSSNTAKLVNMDVWYATTLWLALLSGWIDPSSGRRTRKNPTGGILMKPIMPPALLTPQTLDDSYYYDQGGAPMQHPAMQANYPIPGPAFNSMPQSSRLWRSVDDSNKRRPGMAENSRPFLPPMGPQRSSMGRAGPNNPSQRFPQNSQFHPMPPQMRGMGAAQNKAAVSHMDRDSVSEEGPSFSKGSPFGENRGPFNSRNPFMQDNQFNKEPPLNDHDQMADSVFGPSLEWSGRQRRQPSHLPSPPSMENPWDQMSRYGSMRSRQAAPPMLGLEDKQGQQMSHFDESDSQSEEQPPVNILPRQRKGLAQRAMMQGRQQGMANYPFQGQMNSRVQQRQLPPMPPQSAQGQDSLDYFENRHAQQSRALKLRNGNMKSSSHSRMANVEELQGDDGNSGDGLLKLPTAEKKIKSEKLVQQPDDEFVVESEERVNGTTGKPSEQNGKEKEKSVEASDESKNTEDSGSSEETTTKKVTSHKSKSQHEHKHKEAVAVQTDVEESVGKHVHGRNHHSSSKSKVKSNESGEDEKEHGSPKKRRPRTTLATDFEEDKKEVAGETIAVEPKKN